MEEEGKVVLLIDGAAGLGAMGVKCFQNAEQVVDFYHAMEHGAKVLDALIGKGDPEFRGRLRKWNKDLLKDPVDGLIQKTRKEAKGTSNEGKVEEELGYIVSNVPRRQYGTSRAAGYFIGPGVVAAGCKTVLGGRCKQSGMRCSVPGAENIIALRCIHGSRRLGDLWKHRLDSHASRNDSLHLAA